MRQSLTLLALLLSLGLVMSCTKEENKGTDGKSGESGSSAAASKDGATGAESGDSKPGGSGDSSTMKKPSGGDGSASRTPSAASGSPEAFFVAVQQAAEGNVKAVWDALPSSYQGDVNRLVKRASESIDPALSASMASALDKLGRVLDTKADFILANPLVSMMTMQAPPGFDVQSLKPVLGSVGKGLSRLGNGQLKDLAKFNVALFIEQDLAPMVGSTLRAAKNMPGVGEQMNQELNTVTGATFKVTEHSGDTATVEVTDPDGQVETMEMVRVDGKYIPKEMAEQWSQGIADAEESMQPLSGEDAAMMKQQLDQLIHPTLDQLLAAQDAADFNQKLNMIIQMAQQMQPR